MGILSKFLMGGLSDAMAKGGILAGALGNADRMGLGGVAGLDALRAQQMQQQPAMPQTSGQPMEDQARKMRPLDPNVAMMGLQMMQGSEQQAPQIQPWMPNIYRNRR